MLGVLKLLRDTYGAVGVKAEFESEGVRVDEMLRFVDLSNKSQMKLGIKIGGCEAVKDALDAKQFGADYLIAPMIESRYALTKYNDLVQRVYCSSSTRPVALFNVETRLAYDNFDSILDYALVAPYVDGIVFGRVDFASSNDLSRADINSALVNDPCLDVSKRLSSSSLDYVVGGAISSESITFLRHLSGIYLSRFETRKIIFDSSSLSGCDLKEGLLLAVKFELLWLLNKRNYYTSISSEDDKRIEMLEARWCLLNDLVS
ncbi:hpcH/HpaI aldolase/citrate lyase family protein [Synechococcus sp. WH 8103]|nr:hpcH/HpaI aldolase/citrate lyase family protein [Synechococcus sp. WH 8103]